MKKMKLTSHLLCMSLCMFRVLSDEAEMAFSEGDLLFTLKVKPLISEKCFACHGEQTEKQKGGLNLTTREGFLAGGDEYSNVLIPKNSSASAMIRAVQWASSELEMPPKENDRLTFKQIQMLERWIDLGAPWPSFEVQKKIRMTEMRQDRNDRNEAGMLIKTSGGLVDEWTYRRYKKEDLWAFLPVEEVIIPEGSDHPIDAFIKDRLEDSGFDLSPQADSKTLIRRASYDLLGLPPSPKEVARFQKKWEQDPKKAWTALIDRLLASPHYGERWAQHWLDIVRYSDTGGYSNDYERSNAWRYRDYVIRSFNEDLPYDDFVIQQLAGDELWEAQAEDERDSELLIATGFLRMGPWDPAMVKPPFARQIFLDDIVNAVGETFLSTTMRCFKCHDHKFDPLPTRDYYRFYAVFSGTQMAERSAAFLDDENQNGFEEERQMVSRLKTFATEKKDLLIQKRESAALKWYEARGMKYVSYEDRKSLPDDQKPPRHVGLDYVDQGRLKVREQDERIWNRRLERFEPMVQSVYNGADPRFLNARKLRIPKRIDPLWLPENRILMGGDLEAPGDQVSPGVLSVTGLPVSLHKDEFHKDQFHNDDEFQNDQFVMSGELKGRRLALAHWIAHPENPLTARSIVNRIWGYHFGKALARNPNNFGSKGARPTHPKLLDWLARDFISGGWHSKRLHRLIMTSETYLQSGINPEMDRLKITDPDNNLLAYFPNRRLTAEEIRDSMLVISGELNTELGGLAIRPEINMEVAMQPRMIQSSIAPAYQPSKTPSKRNRRSLYAYRVRGQPDPFLEIFNQPNPNESCEMRASDSVSPQAFTLFNSQLMSDRSIAFATRLMSERSSLNDQIRLAFELALSRLPSELEQMRISNYVRSMRNYHQEIIPKTMIYPSRITRSLVEEFSGRPFEYEEILPVFEDYIPDSKPANVSSEIRALADFCLILLNSHELLYVY